MTDEAPRHPGKILLDQVMTPLGVSRNKLARDIDVPVGRISDIVAGKRGVTPDTALRFAKYFGTTAELWLRLQADYDLHVARTTSWPEAEPKVTVLEPRAAPEETPAAPPVAATEEARPAPASLSPPAVPTDDVLAETGDAAPEADDLPDFAEDEESDIDIPEPAPVAQPAAVNKF